MHSTMQEASYLSLSAMAERTDKQSAAAEGLSFRSLLGAAIDNGQKTSLTRDRTDSRGIDAVHDFLCSGDTSSPHQAYLGHIREYYPYIESTKLDNAYQHVLSAHTRGIISTKAASLPDYHSVIYLGLATGLLLMPGHDVRQELIEALIQCSLETISHVQEVSDDLSVVHCLIALTICTLYSDRAGSMWHVLGLAMTRCVACGMHTRKEGHNETPDELTEQGRAFWTLFLLDTRVSSALDRPFYLEDPAIAMPGNLTPGGSLSQLVAHASLIRKIRKSSQGETLCTFVNLQHLHESTAGRHIALRPNSNEIYAAGLVEVCKYLTIIEDPSHKMMVLEIEKIFTKHLASFEDKLILKASTPASTDVMLVLAIGAILCRLHALGYITHQQSAYQAINILTLLSTRHTYARGLRDILMESLMTTGSAQPQQLGARLCELIAKVDFQLPTRIEMILLGRKPL